MASGKLTNYLRAHRKRAGLTQRELAFLLGVKARGPVSELEKRHRMPLLRTALALAVIFDVPVEELFSGMRQSVASDISARLEKLGSELAPKVDANKRHEYRNARKLAWLEARRGSSTLDGFQNSRPARACY
jgi:transcriptional regulator with XRE-family HTH domain